MQNGYQFTAFDDLEGLNIVLNESHKSAEAFLTVHEQDRTAAEVIYNVAERALIAAEQFEVCGLYLRPRAQFEDAVEHFEFDLRFEKQHEQSKVRPPETARLRFIQNVATLIALLVKNDRLPEA